MAKKLRTIVFFGSGPVAAAALQGIIKTFDIEAVVTKPRQAHHLYEMPVIKLAEEYNLKVFTPDNKQELKSLIEQRPFTSNVGLVLDYGVIIPKSVIEYFNKGIVNSHFSLLPKLRGADPISFAILNGEKETGVSLMLINEKMDDGPLLAQEKFSLPQDMNSVQLTDRLIKLSDNMLIKYLPMYIEGKIKSYTQVGEPTYSRKLTKDDSIINPNKPAEQLEREVRAFIEWPRSKVTIKGFDLIVTKAHVKTGSGTVGSIYQGNKEFGLYTSKDIFIIDKLIPNGRKEMDSLAFLAGYQL